MKAVAAFAGLFMALSVPTRSEAHRPITSRFFSFEQGATLRIGHDRFDLESDQGIALLGEYSRRFASEWKGSENLRAAGFHKGDLRGFRAISSLAERYSCGGAEQPRLRMQIQEIALAIANNHRHPVPRYVGLPDLPFRLAAALSNPVARGEGPASNLEPEMGGHDSSELDPESSTYWRRPECIPEADLYAGFGRTSLPAFEQWTWNYAGPKKDGGNAGCELSYGSQRIKVKFGEIHSEPFTSRIFHALGYNVDPTDYSSGLRMRYDRRFFTHFNAQPEIKMSIGVLFIPIYTFHFERKNDPFAFIARAVFEDGTAISGEELKARLLRHGNASHGQLASENFRTDIEEMIDYLVTKPANVQEDRAGKCNIGPWGFADLGREQLRELRGAGVLAAWLSWWDSRYENTRLRLVKTSAGVKLQHVFSDLGSGLGQSAGTFRHTSEKPNDFTWTFTESKRHWGDKNGSFEIIHYEPIAETPVFRAITLDDARWMARLIGQLTEDQIVSALVASGFNSAEVKIYTEKLVARRDQLVRDTHLENEIPLLRPAGVADHMNYDPASDGPVRIRTTMGMIEAPAGDTVVRAGLITPAGVSQASE